MIGSCRSGSQSLSGSRRWLIIAPTIRESRESRFIDEPTGPSFSRRAAGPARRDRLRRARFCHRCPPLRAVHARRSAATHSARRPAWTRAAGEDSSLISPWGFPCCVRFPCVHAAATTPVQQLGVLLAHLTQPCQPSPEGSPGRPSHRPFRGLLGGYSRCGLNTRAVTVFLDPLSEG